MKKLSLSMLLALAFLCGFAQPKIQFDQTTYDFGRIKEEGGKVTGRFEFTNVGDSALVLTNVRPGCGCTAANYSHDPVAPGQKGFIEATYNPYNRPGAFNKNIRVTTNEPQYQGDNKAAPHMIFIKGEVIKRPPTQFELAGYTQGNGMSRLKTMNVKHDMLNTQSVNDTFKVRNFWNKPVSYELDENTPYISEVSRTFGSSLMPGQEGEIVLKYDAAKRNAFGQLKDRAIMLTNDSIESKKTIFFAVNIKEDFSKLTAKQLKNSPVASLSALSYDFGRVQKNETKTATITIENKGKSPLSIRTLQTSNMMFKVKADVMEVQAGTTAQITVTFKANSRTANQNATIDVITNDPNNPMQTISLTAQVL